MSSLVSDKVCPLGFPRLLFLLVLFLSPDAEARTLVVGRETDLEAGSGEVKWQGWARSRHSFSLTR